MPLYETLLDRLVNHLAILSRALKEGLPIFFLVALAKLKGLDPNDSLRRNWRTPDGELVCLIAVRCYKMILNVLVGTQANETLFTKIN